MEERRSADPSGGRSRGGGELEGGGGIMASAAGREVGEEAEIEVLARGIRRERRLHSCLGDKSGCGRRRGTLPPSESPGAGGTLVPSHVPDTIPSALTGEEHPPDLLTPPPFNISRFRLQAGSAGHPPVFPLQEATSCERNNSARLPLQTTLPRLPVS